MRVGSWRWWVAGMAAIGALPWLLAAAAVDGRFLFVALCHQLPERTLHIAHQPMALCSRCAGIHLGLVVGSLLALLSPLHPFIQRHGRSFVIAAALLNVVDWAVFHVLPLSHASRIACGALFGASATAWMLAALARLRSPGSRTLASSPS